MLQIQLETAIVCDFPYRIRSFAPQISLLTILHQVVRTVKVSVTLSVHFELREGLLAACVLLFRMIPDLKPL